MIIIKKLINNIIKINL